MNKPIKNSNPFNQKETILKHNTNHTIAISWSNNLNKSNHRILNINLQNPIHKFIKYFYYYFNLKKRHINIYICIGEILLYRTQKNKTSPITIFGES